MAWMDEPEEDDDSTAGAAQALADPRGTFAGGNGAVPADVPEIEEGSPAEAAGSDPGEDADAEAAAMAAQQAEPPSPVVGTEPAGTTAEEDPYAGWNPAAPKVPTAPNLPDASADRDALAHSIAGFDPSKYKPSGGRRALAAIAGALTAFGARNPQAGMQVGEAALDAPLNRARAQEQQREAGLQAQISSKQAQRSDAQQDFNNEVQDFNLGERDLRNQGYVEGQRERAGAARALATARQNAPTGFAPVDPMNPWSGGTVTTAGGKQVPNSAPPTAWLKNWSGTPQGKLALQRMTIQQRGEAAQQMKLNPQETKFFVANGKLAEPSQHTSISIRENPDGSPAAPRASAHGGGAMSTSLHDRIIKEKNVSMTKAQQQHEAGAMSDDEYQQSLQDAQDNYEQRIEEATGQKQGHVTVNDRFQFVGDGGDVLPPSNPAAQQQAQAPAAAVQPSSQAPQRPAQPARAPQPPPQKLPGAGKSFSLSQWLKANPKGNAQLARQTAVNQGFKVID